MTSVGRSTGHTNSYDRVADRLRQSIAAGGFGRRGLLPGERDLAQQFGVSRTTLRRALATLVAEGVIAQRQGLGTVVTVPASTEHTAGPPHPAGGLEADTDGPTAAAGLQRPGPVYSDAVDVSVERRAADLSDLQFLALPPGSAAWYGRRWLRGTAGIVGLERTVAPADLLVTSRVVAEPPDADLYAAVQATGVPMVRALSRVHGVMAGPDIALRLGIPPGGLVVATETTVYEPQGRCCLVLRTWCRPDLFDAVYEWHPPDSPVRPAR